MRLQAPLPLAPAGGVQVGEVVWLAPQADGGGQVFIRGDLSFVWDGGDEAGRRFAAVQLARIMKRPRFSAVPIRGAALG